MGLDGEAPGQQCSQSGGFSRVVQVTMPPDAWVPGHGRASCPCRGPRKATWWSELAWAIVSTPHSASGPCGPGQVTWCMSFLWLM